MSIEHVTLTRECVSYMAMKQKIEKVVQLTTSPCLKNTTYTTRPYDQAL